MIDESRITNHMGTSNVTKRDVINLILILKGKGLKVLFSIFGF